MAVDSSVAVLVVPGPDGESDWIVSGSLSRRREEGRGREGRGRGKEGRKCG